MRKMIYILVVILLFSALGGCNSRGGKVVVENSEYYFVLGDAASKSHDSDNNIYGAHIRFSSLKEMKNDFETGNFTEEELKDLSTLADDSGKVQICNLSELYEPIFPASPDDYFVELQGGGYYKFVIAYTENYGYAHFYIQDKEYYDKEADTTWPDKSQNITITEKTTEPGRNANIYAFTTNDSSKTFIKVILYTITNGDKTLFIEETYYEESSSIPSSIKIVGAQQEMYFQVAISEPKVRPSVEWLSSFGIKEYVETATE